MNIGWTEKGIVLTKKHKKAFVSAFISQTRGENENKSLSLGHNCVINMEDVNRLKLVLVEKKRTSKWLAE